LNIDSTNNSNVTATELGGGRRLPTAPPKPTTPTMFASTDNDGEKKRTRRDNELSDKTNSLGLLTLLFAFFWDSNEETLAKGGAADQLSNALGLDQDEFKQTVSNVVSGDISAISAATATIENINYTRTVDWDKFAKAMPTPTTTSPIDKITIGERQQAVIDTIPLAAAATGISPEFMKGLWGFESDFGTKLVSNTGCEGDWQFAQETWDDMMQFHGAKIAALIEKDYPEKADEILAGYKTRGSLNEYQYDPIVSTYASAFLSKGNSKLLGVDPMERESWGILYTAYNAGAGNAKELRDIIAIGNEEPVMEKIGRVAEQNPYFFKGSASAAEALYRYQDVIEQRLDIYNKQLSHLEQSPNTQLATAFNNGGTAEKDSAQPSPLPFDGIGVREESAQIAASTTPAATTSPSLNS